MERSKIEITSFPEEYFSLFFLINDQTLAQYQRYCFAFIVISFTLPHPNKFDVLYTQKRWRIYNMVLQKESR